MPTSITCPVCSNLCSSQAVSCPKCGHPFNPLDPNATRAVSQDTPNVSKSSNVWKILTILVGIFLVCLFSYGIYSAYSKSETANAPKTVSIPIKAALLYKVGSEPVARTKFYLLNRDLKPLDEDKNGKAVYIQPSVAKGLPQAGLPPSTAGIKEENIKDFIVKTATTDFEGNATFENVPKGVYYIGGFSTTRSEYGYIVWSVRVDTENTRSAVLLNQKNAFVTAEY